MRTFLIIYYLLFMIALNTNAGLSASVSYAVLSEDKERILVMLGLPEYDSQLKPFMMPNGEKINLRNSFPTSGVFNADTFQPIWQFDWYSIEDYLIWSKDFSSLIRINVQALTDKKWALVFIHNGQPVKTYDCDKLLTGLRGKHCFPYETWDWHFRWYEDFELSNDQLKFSTPARRLSVYGHQVPLGYQEFYSFDLKTGEILEKRVENMGFISYIISTFVIISITIILLWVYIKKNSSQQLNSGD